MSKINVHPCIETLISYLVAVLQLLLSKINECNLNSVDSDTFSFEQQENIDEGNVYREEFERRKQALKQAFWGKKK